MDAIMEFLESIGSFFQTVLDYLVAIGEFIGMLIEGVLWLISILPSLGTQITSIFAYCPPFVGIFLSLSFAVILLYAVFKLI